MSHLKKGPTVTHASPVYPTPGGRLCRGGGGLTVVGVEGELEEQGQGCRASLGHTEPVEEDEGAGARLKSGQLCWGSTLLPEVIPLNTGKTAVTQSGGTITSMLQKRNILDLEDVYIYIFI